MQSLHNLLIRNNKTVLNFPKSNPISSLRSMSFLQRPSGALNRGWEDETKALADPDRNANSSLWGPFDPFTERLEIPELDEKPQISTVYDPRRGNLVTEANEEVKKPKEQEKVRVSMVGTRKTGRSRVSWVCENCGATTGQWWGSCPTCHLLGTVKQFSESSEVSKARGAEVSEAAVRSWFPQNVRDVVPQSLKEVNKARKQSEWRIPL